MLNRRGSGIVYCFRGAGVGVDFVYIENRGVSNMENSRALEGGLFMVIARQIMFPIGLTPILASLMRATVFRTDANDLFGGLKGLIADQVYGAQVALASLVLALDDASRGRLSPEGEKAFDRLWSLVEEWARQGRLAMVGL